MPHKCDRPRRAICKRSTFRARSRGRGHDVMNPMKVLEAMKENRVRPSPSFSRRLAMMMQHLQPVQRRSLGRGR